MKLYRILYWFGSMVTEGYTVAESENEIREKATKKIISIECIDEVEKCI